jgi:hypothetical protein
MLMKKSLILGVLILAMVCMLLAACGGKASNVNVVGKWSVDAGQEDRIYEEAGTTFEFKSDGSMTYLAPSETEPYTYYYSYFDADMLIICSTQPCSGDTAMGYAHVAVKDNQLTMIAFEELVTMTKVP